MAEEEGAAAASEHGSSHSSYAPCHPTPSRSLNAKRLRLAATNDVQFLANRIAKLKAEEARAKKEVEKTVKKTKEVSENRGKYETKGVEKLQIKEQIANSKKEERVLVSLNKDKQLKAIWVARQKILNEKKEACNNMRKQKEINECRVHILKEEDRDKNIKRRDDIKKGQEYARMKRKNEVDERAERMRESFEAKIAAEEEEREKKETLATQLVQQEAELIYRLKRIHGDKQKAIRELATAVNCVKPEEIEEDIEGDQPETDGEAQEVEEEDMA